MIGKTTGGGRGRMKGKMNKEIMMESFIAWVTWIPEILYRETRYRCERFKGWVIRTHCKVAHRKYHGSFYNLEYHFYQRKCKKCWLLQDTLFGDIRYEPEPRKKTYTK